LSIDIPIFFTQEDKLIKKLIREQGCNIYKFNYNYISSALQKFEAGYVILGRKIGQSVRSDMYIVKGFSLF
jgi:hypothetical protein